MIFNRTPYTVFFTAKILLEVFILHFIAVLSYIVNVQQSHMKFL